MPPIRLVLLVTSLAVPVVARAQQDDAARLRQVAARFEPIAQLLRDSGFTALPHTLQGQLRARTFEEGTMWLEQGQSYLLVGACDDDCLDMDLRVSDATGQELDSDTQGDPIPVVGFEAPATGDYRLRVEMYDCLADACTYMVRGYVLGGGGDGGGLGELAAGAGDRVERGRLEDGDERLSSGEYADVYLVQGQPGQRLVIEAQSDAFDTYVMVRGPGEFQEDNDDAVEGNTNSRLDLALPVGGEYRVVVTSYQPGETGSYVLTIGGEDGGGKDDSAPGDTRTEYGRLEAGDRTLEAGEYLDTYTVEGRAGAELLLDLRTEEFDPYLMLRGPGEFADDNDDFEGSVRRSLIRATLPAAGTYTIGVTSYAASETGAYVLQIRSGASAPAAQNGTRRERGSLASGDAALRSGEFADEYTLEGAPGQRLVLDLQGRGFDPYLMLVSPAGDQEENDDWQGSTSHSRVETTLTESGTYRVIVTSYAVGETGDYDLTMEFDGAVSTGGQRDVEAIVMGQAQRGRLEEGDGQLENGEFRDIYVFDGEPGQLVTIDMRSGEIDTYLGLVLPNGEVVQNDDHERDVRHSRIELTLQEAGRHRIVATSYAPGESGAYELTLASGGRPTVADVPRTRPAEGGPRLFGVFAGISRYGGRANDLPYTAEDAVRVRDAMLRGPGMPAANSTLLTDEDATAANIRGAVARYAEQMGPDDLLVFFYSGHGGRLPRSEGFQRSDPDGVDETLEFYDRGVSDDEFAEWLNLVTEGRVLLVLDACFSGGFAKDVISRPDRMGLFSSEEDVTSSVAAKFRAGGYLAVFLADAVADNLADSDGDGAINALELSQYIHDRYRMDVKSTDPGDYVRTGGPQLGYQHLVVDRGGVGPYDVLFR